MPRIQSFAPLMRSIAAPRAVTCRQQCRFSTASRMFAEKPSEPSKKPSLPPNATSEAPSTPKKAQRAADLAAAEAVTESDSAQPPEPKPTLPSTHSKPSRNASSPFPPNSPSKPAKPNSTTPKTATSTSQFSFPPPKYHVSRTASKNLPIYTDYKRGGNLHLTTVRKITGDLSALRDELREVLNKQDVDVKINPLTQHVIVKGHHAPEIQEFLKTRGM